MVKVGAKHLEIIYFYKIGNNYEKALPLHVVSS
ncbi:hypothetical protein NIES4072_49640 [Nostoc commune NIES-4072]|uniref:Uncharacterized protein n=1 Tax=Nostoc commune NIES-4072 TaxID=2005467 RepID=A0A2R5FRA5_NOSCO|nr:hypothetical protein NIES4070_41310 [Nostoc commune HK-02]GBG21280.1 hypothetical protein NIES4072_49640 [Nostoc commune NIES-4072]